MRHGSQDHDQAARSRRAYARDLGLDMVDRANRWLISGAVILAGGVSALTWHAFHAHAAAARPPARGTAGTAGTAAQSSGTADSGGASTTPLQAPSSAPAAAPAPVAAAPVSGGS